MPPKKQHADEEDVKLICRNRRAFHQYEIHDTLECGISLVGTEVKSLRERAANLEDAYAKITDGEVWLLGCDIPEYSMGNRMNHKPKRPRKLLLKRREIAKFVGKATQRGFTLVPLRIYFKHGLAKVEIAVARGKQLHDKRQSLKEHDAKRAMQRATGRKR
jgi:SsrA-binding protein